MIIPLVSRGANIPAFQLSLKYLCEVVVGGSKEKVQGPFFVLYTCGAFNRPIMFWAIVVFFFFFLASQLHESMWLGNWVRQYICYIVITNTH
jgi:hypothetical protein